MKNKLKFSAIEVKNKTKKGKYSDGYNNLYLQVSSTGTKSWIFRYTFHGKRKEMGIGSYPIVSLADARKKAHELFNTVKNDVAYDPIFEREKTRHKARIKQQKQNITFQWCAEQYINANKAGWKNHKHAQQWTNTLTKYVYPIIGHYSVAEIDTDLIMKVLEPVWHTKTETASRVRGRVEKVLAWASVYNYRSNDNPATWKGQLEQLLPKPSSIKHVIHHKAIPYKNIYQFIKELRTHQCMSAYALEFGILTAARTENIIGAKWSEIDFDDDKWTIQAENMKIHKTHTVPLSSRAMEIIKQMQEVRTNGYIFFGRSKGGCLSNNAMDTLVKDRMKYDFTIHGMRSTFRDWLAELTDYPNEMGELALAHIIKNASEAAYRRGDMFEKRRSMMEDWSAYCELKNYNHYVNDIIK